MSKKKKKKKGSIFMRKGSLKVWVGRDGEVHSRVRGSMSQNISNYDILIEYLKDQATAMAGSAVMTLGDSPDVIIGTTTQNPKLQAVNTNRHIPNQSGAGGSQNTTRRT